MSRKFYPESVCIETDRLLIRPPKPGDGAVHDEAVQISLADLRAPSAALPWAHEVPSKDHSEKYCSWAYGEFAEGREFPLLFFLRKTNEVVGASGLHTPDWTIPSFEIGWWGRSDLQGRGLVTEGVSAVLAWGFDALKAHRIYADVDEQNQRSWRVCERTGMKFEGLMRNARMTRDGQLRNCRLYASIR